MKSSKFKESHQSVGLIFWKVSTLWQRKIKENLNKIDLTHTQFVILASIQELNERNEIITQKEISDFSFVDTMTVSSVLRLLEKKKLITRIPHPKDTRANKIEMTSEGEKIIHLAIPVVEAVDDEFFFDDDKKNIQFIELLKKLEEDSAD